MYITYFFGEWILLDDLKNSQILITNKLWHDMGKVGAKPFMSWFYENIGLKELMPIFEMSEFNIPENFYDAIESKITSLQRRIDKLKYNNERLSDEDDVLYNRKQYLKNMNRISNINNDISNIRNTYGKIDINEYL